MFFSIQELAGPVAQKNACPIHCTVLVTEIDLIDFYIRVVRKMNTNLPGVYFPMEGPEES